MMSLIETNLYDIVKKQYLFKIKANFNLLYFIVVSQIIGILLSLLSGTGSASNGSLTVTYYNASIVIVFTFIGIFMTSLNLTTDSYRNKDFAFVTNRLTSNISNILILISLCIISSLAVVLCDSLMRVLTYLVNGTNQIAMDGFTLTPSNMLLDFITITLLSTLIGSIGYFFGCLIQKNKIYILSLPTIIVGLLFSVRINSMGLSFLKKIFEFYFNEISIPIYGIKLIITTLFFFYVSTILTNSIEVRK